MASFASAVAQAGAGERGLGMVFPKLRLAALVWLPPSFLPLLTSDSRLLTPESQPNFVTRVCSADLQVGTSLKTRGAGLEAGATKAGNPTRDELGLASQASSPPGVCQAKCGWDGKNCSAGFPGTPFGTGRTGTVFFRFCLRASSFYTAAASLRQGDLRSSEGLWINSTPLHMGYLGRPPLARSRLSC
jgi:hypothetical protein